MKRLLELITNDNGRASTTGTIQFCSWLVITIAFFYGIYFDKPYITDWFYFYAGICVFGSPMSKGVVSLLAKSESQVVNKDKRKFIRKPNRYAKNARSSEKPPDAREGL